MKIFQAFIALLIIVITISFIIYYSINLANPAHKGSVQGFSVLCRGCDFLIISRFRAKVISSEYGDIIITAVAPVHGGSKNSLILQITLVKPGQKSIHFGKPLVLKLDAGTIVNGLVINE